MTPINNQVVEPNKLTQCMYKDLPCEDNCPDGDCNCDCLCDFCYHEGEYDSDEYDSQFYCECVGECDPDTCRLLVHCDICCVPLYLCICDSMISDDDENDLNSNLGVITQVVNNYANQMLEHLENNNISTLSVMDLPYIDHPQVQVLIPDEGGIDEELLDEYDAEMLDEYDVEMLDEFDTENSYYSSDMED